MYVDHVAISYLAAFRGWIKRGWNIYTIYMSYVGPTGMGSFDKAEPYLKYLEHLDLPKSEIKKVFVDGDDVCELHELNFDTLPAPMFVCSWYHVDDVGKITLIRVVFDPRPYLQEQRSR